MIKSGDNDTKSTSSKVLATVMSHLKEKQDVEFYNQGEVQLGKTNIIREIAIRL